MLHGIAVPSAWPFRYPWLDSGRTPSPPGLRDHVVNHQPWSDPLPGVAHYALAWRSACHNIHTPMECSANHAVAWICLNVGSLGSLLGAVGPRPPQVCLGICFDCGSPAPGCWQHARVAPDSPHRSRPLASLFRFVRGVLPAMPPPVQTEAASSQWQNIAMICRSVSQQTQSHPIYMFRLLLAGPVAVEFVSCRHVNAGLVMSPGHAITPPKAPNTISTQFQNLIAPSQGAPTRGALMTPPSASTGHNEGLSPMGLPGLWYMHTFG